MAKLFDTALDSFDIVIVLIVETLLMRLYYYI